MLVLFAFMKELRDGGGGDQETIYLHLLTELFRDLYFF